MKNTCPDYPVAVADWDRMVQKIEGNPGPEECWVWRGARDGRKRYGRVTVVGKARQAHRTAWLFFRGEPLYPLTLDHLCQNKLCVNPWHLEPKPMDVHLKDTKSWKGNRGGCKLGHPLDGFNASNGQRYCMECKRVAQRRAYMIQSG